jgi:hypothetical protein
MSRECSINGGKEVLKNHQQEILKTREHYQDQVIDGGIILSRILER